MEWIAEKYPERTTGSGASNKLAVAIAGRLSNMGLDPTVEPFHATVDGNDRSLQNVWTSYGPLDAPIILLIANRDVSPLTTEGANANASGAGALLELARLYSLEAHEHTLLFLWTDGDAYGGVGTSAFLQAHPDFDVAAAISISQIATPDPTKVVLNGWSAGDKVAPAWFWATAESAGKAESRLPTPLPSIGTQLMRLAVPIGSGSAAPLVAGGVPAITISVAGRTVQPVDDTMASNTSKSTLTRAGRTIERFVDTIDEQQLDTMPRSASALFFSRYRQMSGAALGWALAMLVLPILVIAVDSAAAARRAHARLGPAWLLYGLRLAPWIGMLIVVYLANATEILPRSPGAAFLPDSWIADHPRYLRMLVLFGILIGAVLYAHAIERRVERRLPISPGASLTVVHISLVVIAFFLLIVNPFSLILAVPAAIFWPLVRLGPWQSSRLPAYAGALGLAAAALYFATSVNLGFNVWWYFFLLLENRTIPVLAAVLGAALVAGALHLGHHLYRVQRQPAGRAREAAAAGEQASTPAPALERGGDQMTPGSSGEPSRVEGSGSAASVPAPGAAFARRLTRFGTRRATKHTPGPESPR